MKATYETGLQGEEMAEKYLREEKGMRCLEKRHREKAGEIDLIMEDGETLVFVEVKARFSAKAGEGLMSVTAAKQRRIWKAATMYLMKHGWLRREIRFDVVEINADQILHIPNAFQPGGMMFEDSEDGIPYDSMDDGERKSQEA